MCDQAGQERREAARAALLRRPRTQHPRSVARRQTPRGLRQALLGAAAQPAAHTIGLSKYGVTLPFGDGPLFHCTFWIEPPPGMKYT